MFASEWLQNHSRKLNFEAYELDNPFLKAQSYFEFVVRFKINGQMFEGRSISKSRKLAFEKSCSEMISRAVWTFSGQGETDSGVSAHPNEVQAKKNSKLELLERDIFLCHLLTSQPFTRLSREERKQVDQKVLKSSLLPGLKVDVEFAKLPISKSLSTVCCVFRGGGHKDKFGLILGLGTSNDFSLACQKAYFEALTGYNNFLVYHNSITSQRLWTKTVLKPEHHDIHALNMKYAKWFDHVFFRPHSNRSAYIPNSLRSFQPFKFNRLRLPDELKSIPLVVIQATHCELQPFFFGKPSRHQLNFDRINKFRNKVEINWELIHPLG